MHKEEDCNEVQDRRGVVGGSSPAKVLSVEFSVMLTASDIMPEHDQLKNTFRAHQLFDEL